MDDRSDGFLPDGQRAGPEALPALAAWAVELAAGVQHAVVMVAGAAPPLGALAMDGPTPAVAAALPDVAFAAVADSTGSAVRWATGSEAVRAVVGRFALPPGAAAVVGAALDRAPAAGGRSVAPVVAAASAAAAAERAALAARLHDGPVQDLSAAQLMLDSALWDADLPEQLKAPLNGTLVALRAAITDCRGLMEELAAPAPRPGA